MRCLATLGFCLIVCCMTLLVVRVAMLCPQLLEAAYVSHCISDLQLHSVKVAAFCSRAGLRSARLELGTKFALQPIRMLLQLLKALDGAGCVAVGRYAAVCCQADLEPDVPQAIAGRPTQVHLHVAQLLAEIGLCSLA